eukprot:7210900-Karenia_brevis.AAC.1
MEAKDNRAPYVNSSCTTRRPSTLIYPRKRGGPSANRSRLSSRAMLFLAWSRLIKSVLISLKSAHVNSL